MTIQAFSCPYDTIGGFCTLDYGHPSPHLIEVEAAAIDKALYEHEQQVWKNLRKAGYLTQEGLLAMAGADSDD